MASFFFSFLLVVTSGSMGCAGRREEAFLSGRMLKLLGLLLFDGRVALTDGWMGGWADEGFIASRPANLPTLAPTVRVTERECIHHITRLF